MMHPQTIEQYRKFFKRLGISRLEIREKYGDLRKRETWEKAIVPLAFRELEVSVERLFGE